MDIGVNAEFLAEDSGSKRLSDGSGDTAKPFPVSDLLGDDDVDEKSRLAEKVGINSMVDPHYDGIVYREKSLHYAFNPLLNLPVDEGFAEKSHTVLPSLRHTGRRQDPI